MAASVTEGGGKWSSGLCPVGISKALAFDAQSAEILHQIPCRRLGARSPFLKEK